MKKTVLRFIILAFYMQGFIFQLNAQTPSINYTVPSLPISNYVDSTSNGYIYLNSLIHPDSFFSPSKSIFTIGTHDRFYKRLQKLDNAGNVHSYYTQYYKGLVVYPMQYNFHTYSNKMMVNGNMVQGLNIDTTNKISRASAISIAKSQFSNVKILDNRTHNGHLYNPNHAELMIYTNKQKDYYVPTDFVLVYKINIAFDSPNYDYYSVYIHAVTGQLIRKTSNLRNNTATTCTHIYGTQSMPVQKDTALFSYFGGKPSIFDSFNQCNTNVQQVYNPFKISRYHSFDSSLGVGLISYCGDGSSMWTSSVTYPNVNATSHSTNLTNFHCADTFTAMRTVNQVHWIGAEFLKMIQNKFSYSLTRPMDSSFSINCTAVGVGGISSDNRTLKMVVSNYFSSRDNAHWDSATNTVFLWMQDTVGYPDYRMNRCNYVATIDIVGHELGHMLQTDAGNEMTYYKESGALNESFGDVIGYITERHFTKNFSTGHSLDWTHGEDIGFIGNPNYSKNPSLKYQRSLSTPELKEQPSIYEGQYWVDTKCCIDDGDGCGVHTNSGVHNHWFYLMTQGGTKYHHGKNWNVSPIGEDTLENLVFHTFLFELTTFSRYIDARRGYLAAVDILYGGNPSLKNRIAKAWDAVGVFDTADLAPTLFVFNASIGNNTIDGQGKTYYVTSNILIPSRVHVKFKNITLKFAKDVRVFVQTLGCLQMDNAHFTSLSKFSCDTLNTQDLWKGIEIEGYTDGYGRLPNTPWKYYLFEEYYWLLANNYKVYQSNNPIYVGLDLRNSTISFADTAIQSGIYYTGTDSSSRKRTGCDISLYNMTFANNIKDIYYVMDANSFTYVDVKNSKFITNYNNYSLLKGGKIEIWNDRNYANKNNSLKCISCTGNFNGDVTANYGARVSFYGNRFEYSTEDINYNAQYNYSNAISVRGDIVHRNTNCFGYNDIRIWNNTFKGGYAGIMLYDGIGGEIKGNNFDSVDYPIYASSVKQLNIINNTFKNSYIGIKSTFNSSMLSYAKLGDSSQYLTNISNNVFRYPAYRAVELLSMRNVTLTGNTIVNRYSQLPTMMSRAYLTRYDTIYAPISNLKDFVGINLVNNYKLDVNRNALLDTGTNPYFAVVLNYATTHYDTIPVLYHGLAVTNSNNTTDRIYKNTIKEGYDVGIYTYGQNKGLRLRCNIFGSSSSNTPNNLAGIYAQGNLRWQGCKDAYITNPNPSGPSYPCNDVNDPAANLYYWSGCAVSDEAKVALDSPYLYDFRYFTQTKDMPGTLSPYVDNSLTSYCFNVPLGYAKNKLTNCNFNTNAYQMQSSTCEDSTIKSKLTPRGKLFQNWDWLDSLPVRLSPYCDYGQLAVDKSYLVSRLADVKANNNFDVGIDNISKETLIYNIRNQIEETEYEILDFSERCRDSVKFFNTLSTTANYNIQLNILDDKIYQKQYTAASEYRTSIYITIQADSDIIAPAKTAYLEELNQYSPLLTALSSADTMDSLSGTPLETLKNLSSLPRYRASYIAHSILESLSGQVYPLNIPTIPIANIEQRWIYYGIYQNSPNPYQFEIFPNPTAGMLQYQCELDPSISQAKITVFSVSNPNTYLINEPFYERSSVLNSIDLSGFSTGYYIVTLWVGGSPSKSYTVQKE